MDPFTIFAIASAIFGGASVVESQKAAKRQRRAQASEREMTNLRAAKERRQAIRDMRLAYGTAENNAALGGVSESSGALGGQGSIITQGNANISFLDQQLALSNQAADYMNSAAKAQGAAAMWSGLSQLAASGMDFLGSQAKPVPTPAMPPQTVNTGTLFQTIQANKAKGIGKPMRLGMM